MRLRTRLNKKTRIYGCLTCLLSIGYCYLCGTLPLAIEWVYWTFQDTDGYRVQVQHTSLEGGEGYLLTVCDGQVVRAECVSSPYLIDGKPDCSFDQDLPDSLDQGDQFEGVHQYTISNLYSLAFRTRLLFPICKVRLNTERHYPKYVGCFFIEGSWTELSEYEPIDCSRATE